MRRSCLESMSNILPYNMKFIITNLISGKGEGGGVNNVTRIIPLFIKTIL